MEKPAARQRSYPKFRKTMRSRSLPCQAGRCTKKGGAGNLSVPNASTQAIEFLEVQPHGFDLERAEVEGYLTIF